MADPPETGQIEPLMHPIMLNRAKKLLRIPILTTVILVAAMGAWTAFRTVQHYRLRGAFANHDYVGARRILEQGADPNGGTGWDGSLLRQAVMNGDAEAAELLLTFGANPNLKDRKGYTALDYRWEYTTEAVINVVTKYGGK